MGIKQYISILLIIIFITGCSEQSIKLSEVTCDEVIDLYDECEGSFRGHPKMKFCRDRYIPIL